MNERMTMGAIWKRRLMWGLLALGAVGVLASLKPQSRPGAEKALQAQEAIGKPAYAPVLRLAHASPKAANLTLRSHSAEGGLVEMADPPPPPPPPLMMEGRPQMLVRQGEVRLEVAEVETAMTELARIAKAAGGYVADTERERRPSGKLRGAAVLRVPADRLEQAGKSAQALGTVLSESSQVEDVTKAYADLEGKLAVRHESAKRVRDMLRQQAGNLKEVLEAEKELTRLQEEIEGLEGERRFTLHQVRFTTLRVSVEEPESISLTRPSSWSVLREAALDGALVVAESLAMLLRTTLALLPWALLAGALLWGYRRIRKPRAAEVTP